MLFTTRSRCINYRIERLLFYERVEDVRKAIKEADDILDNTKDGMTQNLVLAFYRHMYIHSDRLSDADRRRIASQHFTSGGQAQLLLNRRNMISIQTDPDKTGNDYIDAESVEAPDPGDPDPQ